MQQRNKKMTYNSKQGMYTQYTVGEDAPLLEWLMANIQGMSRNKLKDILKGRGVKVNGKVVTQFDYPLLKGMTVSLSRSKKNDTFKNRFVKVVYEDRYLVVVEKNPGISPWRRVTRRLTSRPCSTTISRPAGSGVRHMSYTGSTATPRD